MFSTKKLTVLLIFLFILHTASNTLYSQWLPEVRLTNDTSASYGSFTNGNWIAANGSSIHIVWFEFTNSYEIIYYKRSDDNGETWSNRYKINNENSNSVLPVIAASGDNVYIVWNDDRNDTTNLYFIKSTDNGISWSDNIRLVSGKVGSGSSIICEGSKIFITWTDLHTGNAEIYFKSSTNNGNSWSSNKRITNNFTASQFPSIDFSNNTLHLLWLEQSSSDYELYYSKSADFGVTWTDSFRLVNSESPWISHLSSSGNNIHIAYRLQTSPLLFNNFYLRSTDNGVTWNSPQALTSSNYCEMPVVKSSGNTVHYAWNDYRTGENGIYYRISTDNGLTWSNELKLSENAVQQTNVGFTLNYSSIHMVWEDSRDGNKEIYYKRNLTGNGPFSISGLVTFKDNNQPVSGGFVKALVYDVQTSKIITVDSAHINSNGTYTLPNVPGIELDLMYYQNDDLLQFVPTYYISTIDWREATKITPAGNLTNINCQVYRINNNTNPFNILGHISANFDFPVVKPVKDAIIYVKSGNMFKNYGISDANGNYTATKLPSGSYEIITYRMGYLPAVQNVMLNNSNLENINFNLGYSIIGIQQVSTEFPESYTLSQNYPNPFNPVTTIKFGLPVSDFIKLEIFDILGRNISTLVNEKLNAGIYTVEWNSHNKPSGIYFYRLSGSNFSETKKMILIK